MNFNQEELGKAIERLTQLRPYASGEFIEVNEDNIKALLEKGAEVTGLRQRDFEFGIYYFPSSVSFAIGVNATYNAAEKKFYTPEQQHEATMFHEGIHYLMSHEGMLFGPDEKATIYDTFVDETVAEFAASQVYGYIEPSRLELCKAVKRKDPKEIDKILNILGFPALVSDFLRNEMLNDTSNKFHELELYNRHKAIEEKFRQARDFEAIAKDAEEYHDYLMSIPPYERKEFRLTINFLSHENAKRLRESGILPSHLVAWIKDAVQKGFDSYGIYFSYIVGAIK